MSPRGMTSSTLLFQVRTLAQTLSEKVRLSTRTGALIDPLKEIEAAAMDLADPSAKRKQTRNRTVKTPIESKTVLETMAESYLLRHVLSGLKGKDALAKARGKDGAPDFRKAAWKIFQDMENTQAPATLLACLILNLRDAHKDLQDLDETGEIPVSRFITVLAHDIYAAKAKLLILCQGASLDKQEKIRLGREITTVMALLEGLASIAEVTLPPEHSNYKVDALEKAKTLLALAEKQKVPTKKTTT